MTTILIRFVHHHVYHVPRLFTTLAITPSIFNGLILRRCISTGSPPHWASNSTCISFQYIMPNIPTSRNSSMPKGTFHNHAHVPALLSSHQLCLLSTRCHLITPQDIFLSSIKHITPKTTPSRFTLIPSLVRPLFVSHTSPIPHRPTPSRHNASTP